MSNDDTGFRSVTFTEAGKHALTLPSRREWQMYVPSDEDHEALLKWLPKEALEDPKVKKYLGWSEAERGEGKESLKVIKAAQDELGYELREDEAERTVQYFHLHRATMAAPAVPGMLPEAPPAPQLDQSELGAVQSSGNSSNSDSNAANTTSPNTSSASAPPAAASGASSSDASPSPASTSSALAGSTRRSSRRSSSNMTSTTVPSFDASHNPPSATTSSAPATLRRSSRRSSSNNNISTATTTPSLSVSPAPPSASSSSAAASRQKGKKAPSLDHLAMMSKKRDRRLFTAAYRFTDWPYRDMLVKFGKQIHDLIEATDHLYPGTGEPFDLWIVYRCGSGIACVEWRDGELIHKVFDIEDLLSQTDRFYGIGQDFLACDRTSMIYHFSFLRPGTPFIWGHDGGNKTAVWRRYTKEKVIGLMDGSLPDDEGNGLLRWCERNHGRRLANAAGVFLLPETAQRLEMLRNEEKGRGKVVWRSVDPALEGPGVTGAYWANSRLVWENPEGTSRSRLDDWYTCDPRGNGGNGEEVVAAAGDEEGGNGSRDVGGRPAAGGASSSSSSGKRSRGKQSGGGTSKKAKKGLTAEEKARRCPFACQLCWECEDVERMRRDDESEVDFGIRHLFEVHLVPALEGEEIDEEEKERRDVLRQHVYCPAGLVEGCRGWKYVEKTEEAVRKHCKECHDCGKT